MILKVEEKVPDAEAAAANLRREQRKIRRGAALAFLLCATVLGAAHMLLPHLVRLTGDDLESQLTFWAGASLFVILWVMIGVGIVSTGRRHSADDIRGSAYSLPSPKIAVPAAFLQHTLEQSVITIFTQLALVLLLGATALPLLAASVFLFGIGRVTFLAGYPHGAGARSFGMAVTALPSLLAFVLAAASVIERLAA